MTPAIHRAPLMLALLLAATLLRSERAGLFSSAFRCHTPSHRNALYRLGNRIAPAKASVAMIGVTMKDRSSSYWFSVGDAVRVVEDVYSSNSNTGNLRGMEGTVVETWEKCDVDPTCCCAEQVDTNMAVRVAFCRQKEEQEQESVNRERTTTVLKTATTTILDKSAASNDESSSSSPSFYYYFAEEELLKIVQ